MPDATTTIDDLKAIVRQFAAVRRWEPYHSPKNLAMALASEVGELLEPFRWLTCEESREILKDPVQREAIADELADVTTLLMHLGNHTGIDLSEALRAKMVKNEIKYPPPKD